MDKELINSREFAKRVTNYKVDKTIQKEIQLIHYELFGKYFKFNCRNCIMKAYVDIRESINNMTITKPTQKQMGQFEIKKSKNGISKQIHIDHDIITNDNLTDEKAINILRKAPGHIVTFSKFPSNWKELTGMPVVKKPKEEKIEAPVKVENPFAEKVEVKTEAPKESKKTSSKKK